MNSSDSSSFIGGLHAVEEIAYVVGRLGPLFKRRRHFRIQASKLSCHVNAVDASSTITTLSSASSSSRPALWTMDLTEAIVTGLEPCTIFLEVPDVMSVRLQFMSREAQQRFLSALQIGAHHTFPSMYELGDTIGLGTHGYVYHAVNRISNHKCVVKKVLIQPMDATERAANANHHHHVPQGNPAHSSARSSRGMETTAAVAGATGRALGALFTANSSSNANKRRSSSGAIGKKQGALSRHGSKAARRKASSDAGDLPLWDSDLIEAELGLMCSVRHAGILALRDYIAEPDALYFVYEYAPERSICSALAKRALLGPQPAFEDRRRGRNGSRSSFKSSLSPASIMSPGAPVTTAQEKEKEDDRPGVSEATVSRWFFEILSALAFLHSQGIVYGVLHGGNVLVGGGGHVVLADFNVANLLDHVAVIRPQNGPKAAFFKYFDLPDPEYAAPEYFQFDRRDRATSSVDMWSCGVLLNRLLTGVVPYSGKTHSEVVGRVISKQRDVTRFDKLSPQVQTLIDALLVADPSKRISAQDALKCKWITEPDAFGSFEIATEALGEMQRDLGVSDRVELSDRKSGALRVSPGKSGSKELSAFGGGDGGVAVYNNSSLASPTHRAAVNATFNRTKEAHQQIHSNRTKQFYTGSSGGSGTTASGPIRHGRPVRASNNTGKPPPAAAGRAADRAESGGGGGGGARAGMANTGGRASRGVGLAAKKGQLMSNMSSTSSDAAAAAAKRAAVEEEARARSSRGLRKRYWK